MPALDKSTRIEAEAAAAEKAAAEKRASLDPPFPFRVISFDVAFWL